MAAEEDKKFDVVLGGFLVNDLRARAGNLHCPESDVLAAYHERSLPPEEMHSWKEHMVGCARCQAVLAELEATDSLPLQASEEVSRREEALLPKSAEPAAVALEEGKPTPAKFSKKSRITEISRGVRWQWLAPAGALAAGLLVWVAWHENQPLPWKTPGPVKTAKLERSSKSAPEPPSPQGAASPQSDHSQTNQLASLYKDQAAAGGALSGEEKQMAEALKQLEKTPARVRSAPARPSTNKERDAGAEAAHELMTARSTANQPTQEPRVGLAAPPAQIVEGQAEAANGQTQAQLSPSSAAGPSPPAGAEPGKKSKAESPGTALRAAAAAPANPPAAFSEARASRALMPPAADLNLIVTPAKKALWRAGHAGRIEFSNDGGASWSRQSSNVVMDLTAGSAPSEKVCWIVGRAGTILLTTDAGSHWGVLHSPLEEDFGGVRATDALHATIWNLGNTKVFETADGGITWNPASAQ